MYAYWKTESHGFDEDESKRIYKLKPKISIQPGDIPHFQLYLTRNIKKGDFFIIEYNPIEKYFTIDGTIMRNKI